MATPLSWGQQFFPRMQVGPTGMSVPTDPSIYKPPAASPWGTQQVGPFGRTVPVDTGLFKSPAAATPAVHYSWYRNQIKLKPGETLGYKTGQGYYARPGTAGATAAKAPALSETDRLLKLLYGQIETPAQQEARVNRELDAQMAAQKALLDNEYARQVQDAQAQQQAMAAAGAAAAGMSKDLLDQVGGEYNAGAQEISGLAHGLSGMMGAATAADVKAANKGLARAGDPGLTQGGQVGYGGATQQGVENYQGGTLGSQLLSSLGQGESFGLAGMTAAQNLQATQTANAGLMVAMHDIRANQAKALDSLAAGRADLYHTYMNDAKDSQVKAISLIQGLIAQKQASAAAAQKLKIDTAKFNVQTGLAKARIGVSVASLKARVNNQSFQQSMAQIREGRMQKTSAFNQQATKIRLENAALAAELARGQIDVNRSRVNGFVTDKMGNPLTDSDGKKIPSSRLNKLPTPKALSPGQLSGIMQKAQTKVNEMYYGVVSTPGGKLVAANLAPGFDANDPKTWGKGSLNYVEALKTLTRMKVPRNAARDMLNQHYLRGADGRPILSMEERASAVKRLGSRRVDALLIQMRRQINAGQAPSPALLNELLSAPGAPAGPVGPITR